MIVLAFSMIPNVSAATVKIQPPSADNYLNDDQDDDSDDVTNYGASPRLISGHAPAPYAYRTLVKFDLSSIPSGSTINQATLYMYFNFSYSCCGSPLTVTCIAYPVITDWLELESSWDNAKTGMPWSTEGGDYNSGISASTSGVYSGDVWFSWDVTNIVSYWITDGNPNYGFLIKHPTDSGDFIVFNSKEYSNSETRPYLEIEYTSAHAVGGIYAPTDKLSILTPFIALVGLIGTISTIFAIRRWRKD
jgi:hypothetical protein